MARLPDPEIGALTTSKRPTAMWCGVIHVLRVNVGGTLFSMKRRLKNQGPFPGASRMVGGIRAWSRRTHRSPPLLPALTGPREFHRRRGFSGSPTSPSAGGSRPQKNKKGRFFIIVSPEGMKHIPTSHICETALVLRYITQ